MDKVGYYWSQWPEADELLALLQKCAWAPSSSNKDNPTDKYSKVVNSLKASGVFKKHIKVRSWLESNWLNIPEVNYISLQITEVCTLCNILFTRHRPPGTLKVFIR